MSIVFYENVTIQKPVDEVFNYITDPNHIPEYLPSIKKLELLGSKTLQEGSKLKETRDIMGNESTGMIEVSRYEKPWAFTVRSTSEGFTGEYSYKLNPAGDATEVELTATLDAKGIRRAFAPFIGMAMKKQDGGQLERLKECLEELH